MSIKGRLAQNVLSAKDGGEERSRPSGRYLEYFRSAWEMSLAMCATQPSMNGDGLS